MSTQLSAGTIVGILKMDVISRLSAVLINEEYDTFLSNYGNALDHVNKCPSPRFIKSHLPLGLLPRQLQTVNPKVKVPDIPTDKQNAITF